MRKKVDERIRTLIENGVKLRHRSLFLIIGDKSRDQIVNLHYMLSKAVVKSRPSVLWCYKDKLELSSHKKKRAKQVKKLMQRGLLDPEKVDPFSLFLETGGLTYCLYKDSERILGNTFGMCILQDFEALTPNLLARTIETVEGGGLIVLLLRSLSSLTSLYTMAMDVHERFRTESHSEPTGRFNERFLLSLASCKACVAMDDELNILPISSHIRSITPIPVSEDSEGLSEAERNLKNLKEQLHEDFPVGPLVKKKCCTLDQGKTVITFLDSVLDKTPRSTVALLAARGRGKSAALGLAVAGAVAAGYSNIFITAPSPENLKTLFEFICKGFDALEYKEHIDYDVVKSANPEFKKATVRINIFKQHRQTIQYIQPHEHEKLSQVELLVIDEAAAIPLPVVRSLLGPYLVFLSSTVNGYEGTGRSLSLKLLQQLEEQSQISSKNLEGSLSGRLFRKIELSESIRYASHDLIESWLNSLLCLDVVSSIPSISRLPLPSECDLYYVNRDTLFSYHKDSELFLQRMMALYVASHYKNSPNDLQLMADAPAHHLFVLLGPVDESKNQLPDILCVLQVCLEGQISRKSAIQSLSEGHQPFGDQIPWKFCEQFRDTVFPSFSGARVVRIATHPSAMRLGYGSAAVELLTRYFEGKITPISEVDDENDVEIPRVRVTEAAEKVSLLEENIKPRTDLPHLLRHKFAPFYIGQIPNTVTEGRMNGAFLVPFYQDFKRRFARLLEGDSFRSMEYKLAMSVLDPKINYADMEQEPTSSAPDGFWRSLTDDLSLYDLERLKVYTNNLADFHLILDVVPILARLYFRGKLPVSLSYVQTSVLLCVGLQQRNITFIEEQMKLERTQILSLFMKVMKKLYKYLHGIASKDVESTLPRLKERELRPHSISVDDDLKEAAKQVEDGMKSKMEGLLNTELLQQYAIVGGEEEFDDALQKHGGKINPGGVISVKSNRVKPEKHEKQESGASGKKRGKEDHRGSRSNKKSRS
ncbi:RNA CYTIDINE ACETYLTRANSFERASE 2 [Salix viminalis]|uniref:RNA cytidine acetyltransferase n=1 Tax=Salix viminalis TaxID=40686 RepID=A0A9Q0SHX3_SALVM|nr:RNA CYTIDINE ACETYLTRANSFERASE 2 [Salix viminalis]